VDEMNTWGEVVSRLGCTIVVGACSEAYWRRPVPDPRTTNGQFGQQAIQRRGWISIQSQTDRIQQPLSFLMKIAQNVSISIVALTGRIFMTRFGKFEIIPNEDNNYQHFIATVQSRDPKTCLITICNHRSVLDDAFIMGSIMPLWMTIQARFHRWGICTQDICFEVRNVVLPMDVY
jgi:hypothetical protein